MGIIEAVEKIIMKNIGEDTEDGELAYYALTSKSEHYYRDIIAYNLHKKFNNEFDVVREWKRCDIAILKKATDQPVALIEFKVCNFVRLHTDGEVKHYTKAIKKDMDTSRALAKPNTEIFSILFLVKHKEPIPDKLSEVVKDQYRKGINAAFNKFDDLDDLIMFAEANFRIEFPNIIFKDIRTDEKAFGIKCDLGYCVIKG